MVRVPTHGPPTHPGEILLEEFLRPLGITQSELARRIHVSYPRVNEIVKQKRPITVDTAQRLARLFGTSSEFWMSLQLRWDLYHAELTPEVKEIQPLEIAHP